MWGGLSTYAGCLGGCCLPEDEQDGGLQPGDKDLGERVLVVHPSNNLCRFYDLLELSTSQDDAYPSA